MLEQTSTQLVMLYYMGSKKHLPGRIVPLGVPFPGYACGNAHVRTVNDDAGYKIEDFVPCPKGTFLGVEGKLGYTYM